MKKYLIVIEPTQTGFSAYSPDLPGCVSTGRTREEVEQNMRDAIAFHLDGLREEGQAVPEPQTFSAYVELPAEVSIKVKSRNFIQNRNAPISRGVLFLEHF